MPDRWPDRPALTRGLSRSISRPLVLSLTHFFHPSVCMCVRLCVGFRQTSCFPGHSTSLQAGHTPSAANQTMKLSGCYLLVQVNLQHHKTVCAVSKNIQLTEYPTGVWLSLAPSLSSYLCMNLSLCRRSA